MYTGNNFFPYFLEYFNFQQSNVLITWSQEYCAVDKMARLNATSIPIFNKVSHYHAYFSNGETQKVYTCGFRQCTIQRTESHQGMQYSLATISEQSVSWFAKARVKLVTFKILACKIEEGQDKENVHL